VSAVQLARVLGASEVFAVDVVPEKLELATKFGATPLDARDTPSTKPSSAQLTAKAPTSRSISPATTSRARRPAVAVSRRRLMIVAINLRSLTFNPFTDLLVRERRIIGCSDHTRAEPVELMELARTGKIDMSRAVTRTVPLDVDAINAVLDDLERGSGTCAP
jgi:threonine dehydrogenase-like Zn-dependent dehydrogenase